jgi:hypothetical protein
MLLCWRSKSYYKRHNPENDKDNRNKHDQDSIL